LLLIVKDKVGGEVNRTTLRYLNTEADTLIRVKICIASDIGIQFFGGVVVNETQFVDVISGPVLLQRNKVGVDALHDSVVVLADDGDVG